MPLEMDDLMKILPQRYPMLMLDRVIEVKGEKIIALKNISGNEPCFAGHFPTKKVFPGVLLTEAIAQASIVLLQYGEETKSDGLPVLYHTNVKFKKLILPGDQLIIHVNLRKKVKASAIVETAVYINEDLAASGSLTFTMIEV
ncbi:hydroxymyristoyl-ACP dehydratase [Bacillus sp. LL01]|nr:hydroxymyristoyl-ACP dehydratase [Bacillus sp. LL01]